MAESFGEPALDDRSSASVKTLEWKAIEPWLKSDIPASHDFLGNYTAADRIYGLLADGTRSVGIVAPFGAGKTTLVKWIEQLLAEQENKFVVSTHSCWGFETSLASINSMLADAIGKVEERIDTFHVSSLPESYRQTFSAGGEWLDTVSKMFFGQRDPIDQFGRFSALLGDMGLRLVFVVEDLDRNNSKSFDIEEVLGFLQQLKRFPNLSFILTGGRTRMSRIDFSKLCDHIEYLRMVSVQQSAALTGALRERCLNQNAFPHYYLTDSDDNQWHPIRWLLFLDQDDVYPPEAIARLLDTPRAVRHALSMTYRAWRNLHGEIDFDNLLAVNVLRYAAPEAFSFVLRYWDRLRIGPNDHNGRTPQSEKIGTSLRREWEELCANSDWDGRAARTLIDLILPSTPTWFGETRYIDKPRPQGVQYGRYWQRALKEYIAADEIRDQSVIRDIENWIDDPRMDSALVTELCSNEHYSNVWEDLANRFFMNDRDRILLLCEQVLRRIMQLHGATSSGDSQGFIAIWRYANRHVVPAEANALWLEDRITEATVVSLELVNSLWHYWGAGSYTILSLQDRDRVRRHIIDVLQRQLTTAEALESITHLTYRNVFYNLVFDPGIQTPVQAGPEIWAWMGPVLFAGLQRGQVTTATGVCSLIATRHGGIHSEPPRVDLDLLQAFFGDDSENVVDAIEKLIHRVDDNDRAFVEGIVRSAKSNRRE